MSKLALLGGKKVLEKPDETLFHWPIVNDAMVAAQTKVLRDGNMSGSDIARRFSESGSLRSAGDGVRKGVRLRSSATASRSG